jgi:hypothetical protein
VAANRSDKTYLGDGAYVEWIDATGIIQLTTSNGLEDTNTIVLGPSEIDMLLMFLESTR